MNSREFYDKVVEMRFWQKQVEYANRYNERAKALEDVIDNEISRVTRILKRKENERRDQDL